MVPYHGLTKNLQQSGERTGASSTSAARSWSACESNGQRSREADIEGWTGRPSGRVMRRRIGIGVLKAARSLDRRQVQFPNAWRRLMQRRLAFAEAGFRQPPAMFRAYSGTWQCSGDGSFSPSRRCCDRLESTVGPVIMNRLETRRPPRGPRHGAGTTSRSSR